MSGEKLTTRVVAKIDLRDFPDDWNSAFVLLWVRGELSKQGIKFERFTLDPCRPIEQDLKVQWWIEQSKLDGTFTVTQAVAIP